MGTPTWACAMPLSTRCAPALRPAPCRSSQRRVHARRPAQPPQRVSPPERTARCRRCGSWWTAGLARTAAISVRSACACACRRTNGTPIPQRPAGRPAGSFACLLARRERRASAARNRSWASRRGAKGSDGDAHKRIISLAQHRVRLHRMRVHRAERGVRMPTCNIQHMHARWTCEMRDMAHGPQGHAPSETPPPCRTE